MSDVMFVLEIWNMATEKNTALPGHVLITGGTGFIGTALTRRLLDMDIKVSVLTRDREHARNHFATQVIAFESLDEIRVDTTPDVIVNLAGKNLGEHRWNKNIKQQLIDSRIGTTQKVIDYIASAKRKPSLLISGSAVGYYGARADEELTEDAEPADEFQSNLCLRWEETALQAQDYGVRVCISRTGVVMGQGGGALSGLVPMFRKGLGAVAGNGKQWISWIHMHDLLNIFLRFMRQSDLAGPFNNTSPNPVTNREFARTIGKVLKRPVLLHIPGWAMHLMYGEMAHLYLTGQRVIPARHIQAGFDYRYPDIEAALQEALQPYL